jgi:phosphosulfolactate phosphohydrolase-like enzyme
VALLVAGCRGQLRCEDTLAAARIAGALARAGFHPADARSGELLQRWAGVDLALVRLGNSAAELLEAGAAADLEFLLDTVDDLPFACRYAGGEVVAAPGLPGPGRRAPAGAVWSVA